MSRNPAWARDELILALDLYFRQNPRSIDKEHPDIQELSKTLNELPIHGIRPDRARFRNENGVYMKLCNFLRLDPEYEGVGLQAGGKLEEVVWEEFAGDKKRLTQTAEAIRKAYPKYRDRFEIFKSPTSVDEYFFPSGRILFKEHRIRECNSTLITKKKNLNNDSSKWACQVCGFSFRNFYGNLGKDVIECHLNKPSWKMVWDKRNSPNDLAFVCANCHRILHRKEMTTKKLREQVS